MGLMEPYEDPRRSVEERVEDLLARMTLEEKCGLMFHTIIAMNPDGTLVEGVGPFGVMSTSDMVARRQMNHFNVLRGAEPRAMAEWHNRLQQLAEETRLGIPVTISSDPRHAFTDNPLTSFMASTFSQWPEQPGLPPRATRRWWRNSAISRGKSTWQSASASRSTPWPTSPPSRAGHGQTAPSERTPRSPRRWSPRTSAASKGRLSGPQSVACMTKHFPGGGPQKDGEDPHFPYGREQVYPGDNFDYHLIPFEAAFAAGTSQIMPYYGMPVGASHDGTNLEEVGFGFNKDVITGLLRQKYGFDGIVCTDWGLLTDSEIGGQLMAARAWGVEHLSRPERARKALDAGR